MSVWFAQVAKTYPGFKPIWEKTVAAATPADELRRVCFISDQHKLVHCGAFLSSRLVELIRASVQIAEISSFVLFCVLSVTIVVINYVVCLFIISCIIIYSFWYIPRLYQNSIFTFHLARAAPLPPNLAQQIWDLRFQYWYRKFGSISPTWQQAKVDACGVVRALNNPGQITYSQVGTAAVWGVQIFGAFAVGEMAGRKKIAGYPVGVHPGAPSAEHH